MSRITNCLLIVLVSLLAIGCGSGNARKRMDSSNNIKALGLAVYATWEETGKPPANMEELKAAEPNFSSLIKNPLTGDDPGYEYVPPAADLQERSKVIMFYQLRGGKRDETLDVGYADGSVGKPGR